MLFLQTATFGIIFWLGSYLLARDYRAPPLRYAGLGIIAYSLALLANTLTLNIQWALLILPATFWTAATLHLLSPDHPNRNFLIILWKQIILPIGMIASIGIALAPLIWQIAGTRPTPIGIWLIGGFNLFPLGAAVFLLREKLAFTTSKNKTARAAVFTATLFFALGIGLVLLPLNWLPLPWLLLAISLDFEVLGIAIAYWDAFEQGESLLPDFLRSFLVALLTALFFGGQIALIITLNTGATILMVTLLHLSVAAAISIQTFSDPLQNAIDRIVFWRVPQVRQSRQELRAAAHAESKSRLTSAGGEIPPVERARLTRRALSQYGNLPRLASSPLARLAIVDEQLHAQGMPPNTLNRAQALKTLLHQSILRLKPSTQKTFDTTDEWRFFNALYYPYVVGLRPYSRRTHHDSLSENEADALGWLRATVPERTLYNWQRAAAKLVAQDIFERNQKLLEK